MTHPSAQSRLLIVIPAWNEEEVLGDVLEMVKVEKPSFADILVVSDGSTDATADGAMRAGFQYARRMGYEYACQLDADGQHDPREIDTLIETASNEHADVVIGSRFAGKGDYQARGPRKWAMNLFSVILSRVCKTRLSDTTSGFKLYGPRALSLFAHNYPAEYLGDTIGALVIAARSHLVVREVGVQMHPRAGGEPSHNPIKSALFLVRATMALAVSLSRPGEKIAQAPGEDA